MNFWQFIIELIHYAAWPVLVLIIVLLFRKDIVIALRRLKKLGRGDNFAEFMDFESKSKTSEELLLYKVTKDTLTWDYYVNLLQTVVSSNALIVKLCEVLPKDKEYREIKKDAEFRMKKSFEVIQRERPTSVFVSILTEFIQSV